MTTTLVGLALLCLIMSGTAMAQQDKVTPLMSKDLPRHGERPNQRGQQEAAAVHGGMVGRLNARRQVRSMPGPYVARLVTGSRR